MNIKVQNKLKEFKDTLQSQMDRFTMSEIMYESMSDERKFSVDLYMLEDDDDILLDKYEFKDKFCNTVQKIVFMTEVEFTLYNLIKDITNSFKDIVGDESKNPLGLLYYQNKYWNGSAFERFLIATKMKKYFNTTTNMELAFNFICIVTDVFKITRSHPIVDCKKE